MSHFIQDASGITQFGNLWIIVTGLKHVLTVVLVILAIYAFERLAPKVGKLAASGPSPELTGLKKLQMKLAFTGFILGIIILFLTGIMTAISSIS